MCTWELIKFFYIYIFEIFHYKKFFKLRLLFREWDLEDGRRDKSKSKNQPGNANEEKWSYFSDFGGRINRT